MFLLFTALNGVGGNGAKSYQCIACGSPITYSDRLLPVGGSNRHFFVNPSGVECDFHTFYACPGAMALGEPTTLHSWFPGYSWRLAFCQQCGQHLGWYYETVSGNNKQNEFWGILVSNLIVQSSTVSNPGS